MWCFFRIPAYFNGTFLFLFPRYVFLWLRPHGALSSPPQHFIQSCTLLQISNCEPNCEIMLSHRVCPYPIIPWERQHQVFMPAMESQLSDEIRDVESKGGKECVSVKQPLHSNCSSVSLSSRLTESSLVPMTTAFLTSLNKRVCVCVRVSAGKELQCFCHMKRASKSSALKF